MGCASFSSDLEIRVSKRCLRSFTFPAKSVGTKKLTLGLLAALMDE